MLRATLLRTLPLVLLAPTLLLAACGDGSTDTAAAGPEVIRQQDGDTVVVRTVAGSAWGSEADLVPEVEIGVLEGDPRYMLGNVISLAVDDDGRIFAMDRQALTLRVYGPDGSHLGDWGRDGGGPGEFGQPDGGLAVLSDGRVVVRDPGNARLQVYGPDGERAAEWSVVRSGFSTSNPLLVGPRDTIYTSTVINLGEGTDIGDWRRGLIAIHEGEVVDTVAAPDVGYEAPMLRAEREGGTSINGVPFSPSEEAEWHAVGKYWVHGISDEYSVSILDPDGPIRIEREAPAVRVTAGERAYQRESATRNMRGTDPAWRWNGPDIPDTKPAFRDLQVAEDGRIWLARHTEGVRRDNPSYDPTDPESEAPEHVWGEPWAWDVFESDGTFLGTVHAPEGFQPYPRAVFSGDHVWAVAEDDLGVQRIVRYRIELRHPATE